MIEGITRQTVLEIAHDIGIQTSERNIDLTELYIADEVFACGTSAYITPVLEVDVRSVANRQVGPITARIRELYLNVLHGKETSYQRFVTPLL